jgi:RimJ/RimL family protein N-acetyltransferase
MISGKRVVLRPVEERDASDIQGWRNDPDTWWWSDVEQPVSLEDVVADEEQARRDGHAFIVESDGRGVGRIGLERFNRRDRSCSLSVLPAEEDFWDPGCGADAISALLHYAFDRLDLHQVEVWCVAGDDRAIETYEACGFVREATLRDRSFKDGAWYARVAMSVQRKESAAARERSSDDA